MSRHRAYCFTINNYTQSDRFAIEMLMKKAKYGIVGDEIGEDKKTPHLQCYIHLVNDLSFTAIKNLYLVLIYHRLMVMIYKTFNIVPKMENIRNGDKRAKVRAKEMILKR